MLMFIHNKRKTKTFMNLTLKDFIPRREMQFQPVEDDDDDLSKAIDNDANTHDNRWDLREDIDSTQLANFWDRAVRELGAEEAEK